MEKHKVIVLWTGGKDSCLALHLCREQGFEILGLATFIPSDETEFKAHPQSEIQRQAQALSLPIHFIKVVEPYRDSYIKGLQYICYELGADEVATGDIDLVDGHPNWILECCAGLELEVLRPLWQWPRERIMREIISRKIQARLSFINHPKIPQEWLGRHIDAQLLAEMISLFGVNHLDLAGENGEYHTMIEL